MNLRPDEISSVIKEQIKNYQLFDLRKVIPETDILLLHQGIIN
jgi:hypothetical protein